MEPALRRSAAAPSVQLLQMGAPIALRDGSRVRIRRLRDSDLRYLVEIDHRNHEALIAFDEQRNEGVGVARYVRDAARPAAAAAAVTVADDWQGRGLGTLLLEGITMRAREEGVDTFTALMLVENGQTMDLLERLGAVRVVDRAAETVEVEVHLPAIGVNPELRKLIRLAAASDIAIPIGQLPRGPRTRPGSG
jgi:GNAT superfamily N-acetyltransferase